MSHHFSSSNKAPPTSVDVLRLVAHVPVEVYIRSGCDCRLQTCVVTDTRVIDAIVEREARRLHLNRE